MSTDPVNDQDHPDAGPDSHSEAMKDQLRSDVASWMAARSETSVRPPGDSIVPMPKPAGVKPPRAKQAKSTPSAASSGEVKKKPFGMSYDGMSQADYITYMISRGAR